MVKSSEVGLQDRQSLTHGGKLRRKRKSGQSPDPTGFLRHSSTVLPGGSRWEAAREVDKKGDSHTWGKAEEDQARMGPDTAYFLRHLQHGAVFGVLKDQACPKGSRREAT